MDRRTGVEAAACWAGIACVIATLAVAAGGLLYAAPFSDDWNRAAISPADASEYLRWFYTSWGGRWAAVSLQIGLSSWLDPTRHYAALLLGLNAVSALCVLAFVRAVTEQRATWREAAVATAFAAAVFWATLPRAGATVYWLTGGLENQLPIALGLLVVALLLRASRRAPAGPRAVAGIAPGLLAFCAIGLHELYGLVLALVLVTGAATAWAARLPARRTWTVAATCAALGLAVVLLAPGNAARAGFAYPQARDLGLALRVTRSALFQQVLPWMIDGRLLCLSLLIAVHPRARNLRPLWLEAPVCWRALVPSVAGLALVGGFALCGWAQGARPVWRTMDGLYAVFVIGWLATVFVWTRPRAGDGGAPPRGLARAAVLLAGLGCVATPTFRDALWDLEERAGPFRAAVGERYRVARRAGEAGTAQLVLDPLESVPRTLRFLDLREDPGHGNNRAFAELFGLESVRVRARTR